MRTGTVSGHGEGEFGSFIYSGDFGFDVNLADGRLYGGYINGASGPNSVSLSGGTGLATHDGFSVTGMTGGAAWNGGDLHDPNATGSLHSGADLLALPTDPFLVGYTIHAIDAIDPDAPPDPSNPLNDSGSGNANLTVN
jgi:hypothetical protein